MTKQPPIRKSIIVLVVVACVLLYLAGVFSGLYANRITERKTASTITDLQRETREDITTLQRGTAGQITNLNNYIRFLETNLQNAQLQEEFLDGLPPEERCRFLSIGMDHMVRELQYYRDQLPFRLEQYEKENALSPEYRTLKDQYNALSIRTWVFARSQARACGTDDVLGLYFYNATCDTCVPQGEQLDVFTTEAGEGRNVLLFTVDAASDDLTIRFLTEYYKVTALPAMVIDSRVYQGRIFTAEELLEDLS